MAKTKRILCAILSIVMVIGLIPMGTFGASAADSVVFDTAAVDTGDGKLVVPTVTLTSTKVIRVAENAGGATFKNGTTIVPATPSGLPKINSGYVSQYYCDETPASAQIVFTTDTALAATPTISCENNANVTFSEVSQSGNTYTWTVTGGTGVTVGELKFVVDYSNSYVDSLTGKTVTNYFKAFTTSYVENIAQPGAFSAYRSRTGSVGHENVRCSYIVRILGANTYGGFAAYNDEDDAESAHGYYDFINNNWVDLGTTNQAKGYGTMIYEVSNDSGDGSRMINANADHWRPTSTTYVDRGLSTSLGFLNLRLTQFERQGDRKDGYTYYARYSRMKLLAGSVYAHTDAIESNASRLELGLSQDLTSDVQLANFGYTNVPLNGSTYGNASTLDEATGNYVTEYTLVYSGGSHYSKVDRVANADVTMGIRIESYDKSELRGYIDELLVDHDPTTKLAATSEIGIYPQSSFYSAGWDSYKTALQSAQGILNKPNTNQNEVNAALSTLETAVDGLVVAEADYSVVDIAKAEAAKLNALNYTEDSWARVIAAVNAADAAQGYSVFYQSAVDKLAIDINAAVAALEYAEADWNLVDQAVSVYENLDPSKYTPESWINLRNAVNTAMDERAKVPAYTVTDQAYVDSLAKAISDAIDALEDALADYTYYLHQVNRYETEIVPQKEAIEAELAAAGISLEDLGLTSVYNANQWRRLQAALNFERGLTWQYQQDVDDATETLTSAIDNLTLADAVYDDVNYWIEEADAIDASWYTDESYQRVLDAVDAVVEGKKIDEQVTVNSYATAIEEAIKNLELEYADYTEVDKAIERAEAINPSIYTDDSYNAIFTVIDNIDWNLYAKDQDVVDGYVTAIDEAIANLEELPADYSAVEDAKDRWATYTDTSMYTNASVAAVVNAINAVDYSKTITQQAEVDAMAAAINTAIDNLQEKGADYAALKDAFAAAKAELKKHNDFMTAHGVGYYTDATIADLEAAINDVPVDATGAIVEDKKLSEQGDVDALTSALVAADTALEVNPADYSKLNAILLTVPSDEDLEKLYTVDSAANLLAAVINANAVDPDLTVDDQATIDALVAEVDTAIKALKYKDADYTKVIAAKEAAEAELAKGIWTADSVKAVEDAIAAVVEGYDISRQAEVDAMAEAINAKVALLEEEYADYTKVNEAKDAAAEIDTAIVTPESYARVTDAINAVVEGLYAKDQATVDGYAKAINDAIAALEYMYADWSKVDALITEIEGLNPEDYENWDDIYWVYLYSYMYTDIPNFKTQYIYVTAQSQVDAVYAQLLEYKNMLIPVTQVVEYFNVTGGASVKTQAGVNYIVGLQTNLTKAKFQSTFADYENVTLEYKMTTSRYLGTGSTVTVKSKQTGEVIAEYVIVIYGDIDGSATINASDALAVANSVSGASGTLTGAAKLAANVEGTRVQINDKDVEVIYGVAEGTMSIDQATGKGVKA